MPDWVLPAEWTLTGPADLQWPGRDLQFSELMRSGDRGNLTIRTKVAPYMSVKLCFGMLSEVYIYTYK